jgi:glycosyltransferase involved in cell wall biosynthesis
MSKASPPFFSIVTPVFNRQDVILRSLQSVWTQGFADYEHVVVDDGSSDGTAREVQRVLREHPNIKLIELGENFGVNHARNRGIEQSSGEFIIILDSDDYLLPDALQQISAVVRARPEFSYYLFVPSDRAQDLLKKHGRGSTEFAVITYDDWLTGRISGDFTHVIQRTLLVNHQFNEKYRAHEDLTLMQVCRSAGCQLLCNRVLVVRERGRRDSITREYHLDNRAAMVTHLNYVMDFLNVFEQDYRNIGLEYLAPRLRKAAIIGIALGEYESADWLLKLLKQAGAGSLVLEMFNAMHLGPVLFLMIVLVSRTKRALRGVTVF